MGVYSLPDPISLEIQIMYANISHFMQREILNEICKNVFGSGRSGGAVCICA
jgi:hypothetical protein